MTALQSPIMTAMGVTDGMVLVDVTPASDIQSLLNVLVANGCDLKGFYKNKASAICPKSALTVLGNSDAVNFVHPVIMTTNGHFAVEYGVNATAKRSLTGSVTSEGIAAIRADLV